MTPLVSIIIPVYNVEKYLDKCIESIVNQTYTNLEIILVDDGSPDNCPQMCDAWAEKDSRIKVVHKENGGLSSARNKGLDIAKGGYILFVDSDDYISYDCVDILLKTLLENKCDLAVARYIETNNGRTKKKVFSKKTFVFNEADYWNNYYVNLFSQTDISAAFINACGKLYKKELFDNIRFPIGKINEDTFTTYKIISECSKIAYIDKLVYYYVYRPSSITRSINSSKEIIKSLDVIDAMKERVNYFARNNFDKNLIKYAYIDLLDYQIDRYYIAKLSYKNKKLSSKIKKDYNKTYQEAKKYNALDNDLYKKRNSLYSLFYFNDNVFRIVRKIKRMTGNL